MIGWCMIDVEAGAGCLGSSAPDTASENYDDDEAGADVPGCFAPDTASYDKTLGPMFQDALLRIPPVGLLY